MSSDKIKKQVEFYFSDANYRVDAFMKQQSLLNNGYIPIDTILTFKKMKELNACVDSVKQALKESKVVEVKDATLKKIETDEWKQYLCDAEIEQRCLYVSGFDKELSLEDIEYILSEHMDFCLVRMRREKNKKFSGSVFVELKREQDIEKILNLEIPCTKDTEQVKRKKEDKKYLTIMKKSEYLQKKSEMSLDKQKTEAQTALKSDYVNKLYSYKTDKAMDIKDIKQLVKDCVFVDTKSNVLRLKFAKDFDNKEYATEENKINLTKLNEEEVAKYCSTIPVNPKKKFKHKK